jgi:GT2 family glycosyltransferase
LPSRARAAIALLVTAVAGLTVVLVAAGSRSGGYELSNAVVAGGFQDSLSAGGHLCSGPIPRPFAFDRVRFSLAGRGSDPGRAPLPRLRLTVLDGGGMRIAGPAPARLEPLDAARDAADARIGTLPAGRPIRVCIRNAGPGAIRLWSGAAAPARAGSTRIDGRPVATTPELLFYRDPAPSLLARVPAMLRRAAIWRTAALGTWTTWALAALLVLAVPALLALALLRSERSARGAAAERWRRYLDEVEPALLAQPRVHRFAAPPLLGEPDLAPAPVAVAVVGAGDATRTHDGLAGSTIAPAELLEGESPEALLRAATGRHVLLVEAGDVLGPLALERIGQALALAPGARVVTCDHDTCGPSGRRTDPRVLPGPSPDLLLARDLTGAAICVERDAALAALGRGPLEPGAWRYDLALRLAGDDGAGQAHVPMLLVHRRSGAPERDAAAEQRAVQRALAASAPGASVEDLPGGRRRIRRPPERRPSVEAIVLFRDKPELLRRCIGSLLERSQYERLSVRLVDNGSTEPATAALLAELTRDARVSAMRDERPFNFAAHNNAALAASDAEVVVFLNNDTEVLEPDWVEELLAEALRPQVGAVAPLLLYPDGTVQHAGAALGLHGYAGHPFAGLRPDAGTPFGSASDGTRNWLAVTAACMMVERVKLDAVGRYDESFVVAGNDVDLCLRLTAAGYRSLCVPHVRLLHDESQSRGAHIDPGDFRRSEDRYGAFRTVGDPFYSPSLTLTDTTCQLRVAGP